MRRSLALDVLRGIAILLVLGAHLEVPHPEGGVWHVVDGAKRMGWLGVELFFVLSGFLVGGLLLTELRAHGHIRPWPFLVRRGFKIYPLYYLFIGYLFTNESLAALWPNLLFLQSYVGINPALHTWTLAVEEHFYVLLPFALAALAHTGYVRRLVPLCLVVVPLALFSFRVVAVELEWPYAEQMFVTHFRLDALLVGVGIRAVATDHPQFLARLRRWRSALVVIGLAAWTPLGWLPPNALRTVGLVLACLGASAFLLAALHTHARDLSWPLRRLADGVGLIGIYSYGIYLWHITVMGIADKLIGAPVFGTLWIGRVTVILVSVCVVGAILTRLVEWPLLRVRDRLYPSRTALREPVTVAA
jgi:peptidoglycan/LPS O-acetylase OafA/YrhL